METGLIMDKDRAKLKNRIVGLGWIIAAVVLLWVVSLIAVSKAELDGLVFGFQCAGGLILIVLVIGLIAHYEKKIAHHDANKNPRDDRDLTQVRPSTVESVSDLFIIGMILVLMGFLVGYASKVITIIAIVVGVICLIIGFAMKLKRYGVAPLAANPNLKDDRIR